MSMVQTFNFHELKAADRLPSASGTALAILRLLQREDVTAQALAQLVQTDAALTGRVLRLANSASLAVRRPVVSVMDAVLLLGMSAVQQFALSLSLIGQYQRGYCEAFDYPAYWSGSLALAVAIQSVMARERTVAPEEAFTLGLLADIGQLALATAWPEDYNACLRQAQGEALLALERDHFAVDHETLSRMLLADWGFPSVFLDALQPSHAADQQDNSRSGRFARQMIFARAISRWLMTRDAQRTVLVPDLQKQSQDHALEDEALPAFLESVETQWREWGKLVNVSTEIRQNLPSAEEASLPGLEILVVDDDPVVRLLLSQQLAARGHRVATAGDGESAIQHVLEHLPQLVITDWHMQPMDGLQLCRSLRGAGFGQSLYLIMLTGSEDEDALVAAFEAGIDDYLIKPPDLKVLNARIRAGQRIIKLQQELVHERQELERFSAELAVANRRLEQLANTDLLTGLPNRRYALARLEQEWTAALRYSRPLSILILDLDHFKSVNDSWGHQAGDGALVHAGHVMREAVRASDIVCRIGGEEFLVIAPNTDAAAAVRLGERIRAAIERRQPPDLALRRPLTASIGVASCVGARPSWKSLMTLADQAMYHVKRGNRNGVHLAGGRTGEEKKESSAR